MIRMQILEPRSHADHQILDPNEHFTECAVSALRGVSPRLYGHHAARRFNPVFCPVTTQTSVPAVSVGTVYCHRRVGGAGIRRGCLNVGGCGHPQRRATRKPAALQAYDPYRSSILAAQSVLVGLLDGEDPSSDDRPVACDPIGVLPQHLRVGALILHLEKNRPVV